MLPQINAAKTKPTRAPMRSPRGGAPLKTGYDQPAIVDAAMTTTAMKPLRKVRVSKRKRFNSAPTDFGVSYPGSGAEGIPLGHNGIQPHNFPIRNLPSICARRSWWCCDRVCWGCLI